VYTGTHDNDTTIGWYYDPETAESSKDRVRRYANADGSRINWDFIRLAYSSIAETAIIPLQDVLGFGADCRMNRPSTVTDNWRWRCAARFLNDDIVLQLRTEVVFYNRLPDQAKEGREDFDDVSLW
jgi:4-alpha-glucanotransferase